MSAAALRRNAPKSLPHGLGRQKRQSYVGQHLCRNQPLRLDCRSVVQAVKNRHEGAFDRATFRHQRGRRRKIIADSGLPIIVADTLAEAAEKAVQARNESWHHKVKETTWQFLSINPPASCSRLHRQNRYFHAQEMIDYGSNVVGGITPGKGGQTHLGRPVFNTVKQAVDQAGAEPVSCLYHRLMRPTRSWKPPKPVSNTASALPTVSRPGHDESQNLPEPLSKRTAHGTDRPKLCGTISPGKSMLGIMPGHIYIPGNVGIVGRSGTLGYEPLTK